MKLKSRHFENYPISGNQKPLRAFFTHIWGYFVQCDYTLLRMTDHYPHYLIAVEKNKQIITKDYCEVDAGGTPTPIPGYACLHPEKVIEIVLFYFEHLKIPSFVEWDEI
jgi:hypothetical protein